MWYSWKPYVSVAQRRLKAEREMKKLAKKGYPVSPVVVSGRIIARTFWGKSWCDNLERYSDFANRLPRGRTYVRNGSVLDLQIAPGEVSAMVCGSEIYNVSVKVSALPKTLWKSICRDCAGAIDSLVELLQGRFSKGVMERICLQKAGLFPAPAQIEFSCSCPDWATMCKHVAAVLYGIGARLDEQPDLLFKLRKVDEKELIAKASRGLRLTRKGPAQDKILVAEGLSDLFGLDLGETGKKKAGERDQAPTKKARGSAVKKSSRKPASTASAAKTAKMPARKPGKLTQREAAKSQTQMPGKGKAAKTPVRRSAKPAKVIAVKKGSEPKTTKGSKVRR